MLPPCFAIVKRKEGKEREKPNRTFTKKNIFVQSSSFLVCISKKKKNSLSLSFFNPAPSPASLPALPPASTTTARGRLGGGPKPHGAVVAPRGQDPPLLCRLRRGRRSAGGR